MKKFVALLLALAMVFALCACANNASSGKADSGKIKVGVVNNPPSESGYREANVNDFQNVFTEANGYDAKLVHHRRRRLPADLRRRDHRLGRRPEGRPGCRHQGLPVRPHDRLRQEPV